MIMYQLYPPNPGYPNIADQMEEAANLLFWSNNVGQNIYPAKTIISF